MIALGRFFFKYRDFVVPAVLIALAYFIKPDVYEGHEHLNLVLNSVGIAIALSGQILRAVVIGFAYIKRGGKDKEVYADTLQQGGLFAHCRNPLYVGNLLMLLGLILVHGAPLFCAIATAYVLLVYISIVANEEQYLRGKFGEEYVDYCRRVPRWWIKFGGMGKTLEGMHYDWGRLVRKEYGTIFTGVSGILAMLAWESVANYGYPESKPLIRILLGVWAGVIIAWIIARVLKKKTDVLGTT